MEIMVGAPRGTRHDAKKYIRAAGYPIARISNYDLSNYQAERERGEGGRDTLRHLGSLGESGF